MNAWTTEKPTVAGWYWYRDPLQPALGPDVVPVDSSNGPDTDLTVEDIPLDEFTGEWSGPIPLPTDAPAQAYYKAEEIEKIIPTLETAQKLLEIYAGEQADPAAAYTALDIEHLLDRLRGGA